MDGYSLGIGVVSLKNHQTPLYVMRTGHGLVNDTFQKYSSAVLVFKVIKNECLSTRKVFEYTQVPTLPD